MRHFGKRGMDDKLAFIMWEIMVIFMVVIALTLSVKSIANNTTFWKKYHSADLALMTDLTLVNQGDFRINYDMKDLKSTAVSKVLGIDKLVFETVLTNDGYFLYDESKATDRFPQSYVFGKTNSKIAIKESDTTSSYVILNKVGDTFSMTTNGASTEISCPVLETANPHLTLEKKIDLVSISDTLNYDNLNNKILLPLANGQSLELLIIISESVGGKNRIYYNDNNYAKGQKLSCLIKKQLIKQDNTIELEELPYDTSFDNTINAKIKTDTYNYWILIELNKTSITEDILGNSLKLAINEYYGPQTQ